MLYFGGMLWLKNSCSLHAGEKLGAEQYSGANNLNCHHTEKPFKSFCYSIVLD